MINILKKVILKRKLKQAGFNWIKVDKDVIHKYRKTTNRNKDLSDLEIEMKIIRSYYSGHASSINCARELINYGYLELIKDNDKNRITYILNSKENLCGRINYDIKNKITDVYKSVFGGEV